MTNKLLDPFIQAFISDHLNDDPSQLMLSAKKYPEWPMKDIVEQIQSKKKARQKLPNWFNTQDLIYPPVLSLEQCSSESTALYKASLISKGKAMADLTGGFGVDFSYLSSGFSEAHYIERQSRLAEIARHNFKVLGLDNVSVHFQDSLDFLKDATSLDFVYLDPARRNDSNEKVVRLEDCEPNVLEMLPELTSKSNRVMIKTSPLLDIKRAIGQLKGVDQVHVVGVKGEVKELIFILSGEGLKSPSIYCNNLGVEPSEPFIFDYSKEQGLTADFSEVLRYLYEPNATILKAGAFKSVASTFGLLKLHANTHLYTSNELISGFPGRVFEVTEKIGLNKKSIRKVLPEMKANISVRNYPLTVDQIRTKTGIKEGGDQFIFAAQTMKGKEVFLCRKPI